ncbi:cytochrome c peroxidase [soil metagenome]
MRTNHFYILLAALGIVFLLNSFSPEKDYFLITKKDVELKVISGFPKPLYNFKNNALTPEIFTLGRKLFYDPILSKDSSISCSSCHQRIAAFAHIDHPLSHGINGLIGTRNVPALQNLIFRDAFMWDGGVNNLEVQPLNPITNQLEMDEKLDQVLVKLQRNPEYVKLFRLAYNDSVINSERLLKSLTQFTGLMISSNSRYDKYKAGLDTLSENEISGMKIFGQRCANCHSGELFTDNSYRNDGLLPDTSINDKGYGAITGLSDDNYKFKVPSLRNVEMTYPYMHDGRFRNLNQVLDHYGSGKYFTANFDQSLKKTTGLNAKEKSDIIAFLKTLTDKTFLYDRRFADPNFK